MIRNFREGWVNSKDYVKVAETEVWFGYISWDSVRDDFDKDLLSAKVMNCWQSIMYYMWLAGKQDTDVGMA